MQDKQETNNNKLVNNNKLQDKIAILSKEKEEGEIIKNPPVTVVNVNFFFLIFIIKKHN